MLVALLVLVVATAAVCFVPAAEGVEVEYHSTDHRHTCQQEHCLSEGTKNTDFRVFTDCDMSSWLIAYIVTDSTTFKHLAGIVPCATGQARLMGSDNSFASSIHPAPPAECVMQQHVCDRITATQVTFRQTTTNRQRSPQDKDG